MLRPFELEFLPKLSEVLLGVSGAGLSQVCFLTPHSSLYWIRHVIAVHLLTSQYCGRRINYSVIVEERCTWALEAKTLAV